MTHPDSRTIPELPEGWRVYFSGQKLNLRWYCTLEHIDSGHTIRSNGKTGFATQAGAVYDCLDKIKQGQRQA